MRAERARLVGALVRWCGDVQLAEGGFADAVDRALISWTDEVPRDPRAWLVTAARNRIGDLLGAAERTRTRVLDESTPHPEVELDPRRDDDTLAVLLACVHPALDRGVHAPLILQVVLGVSTADIATAFALPTSTLSKRLVRAKQKLRAHRVSFEIPEGVPAERVAAVLDAIYAAYSIEWLRIPPEGAAEVVTEQAIHASQLLLAALPDDHEVRGLAALLLFLHSRDPARCRDDVLVPLDDQDPSLWDRRLIHRAERILREGLGEDRTTPPGPYELQAAVQSAHASRTPGEEAPWQTIGRLYDALDLVTPSKGAAVARAAAIARATAPRPASPCSTGCSAAIRRCRPSSPSTRRGPPCSPGPELRSSSTWSPSPDRSTSAPIPRAAATSVDGGGRRTLLIPPRGDLGRAVIRRLVRRRQDPAWTRG